MEPTQRAVDHTAGVRMFQIKADAYVILINDGNRTVLHKVVLSKALADIEATKVWCAWGGSATISVAKVEKAYVAR